MQLARMKPPNVADEDNWLPGGGWPRMVRCHQCNYWSDWKYVCWIGALDANPVDDVLECWYCYMHRTGTTWKDVDRKFKKLYGKEQTHRVERWQDLLSYVTFDEEEGAESLKKKHKRTKHAFNEINAERIAFATSGGGSSSTERLWKVFAFLYSWCVCIVGMFLFKGTRLRD